MRIALFRNVAVYAVACIVLAMPAESAAAAALADADAAAPLADGRGLKAELFAGGNFQTKVRTRYDLELDFLWGDGAPDPELPADHFSVRWTGFIRAPRPGAYKLITHADDHIKVWLDDHLIIDRGGGREVTTELGDQAHALRVEYAEVRGWAHASLHWRTPGSTAATVIPAQALYHDRAAADKGKPGRKVMLPKGTGLNTEVFVGARFERRIFKRVDRRIDWHGARGALQAGLPHNHFGVRWSTFLRAPKPGRYKLILYSDDGIRLTLDRKRLLNHWRNGTHRNEVFVELTDKPHELVIEYYEAFGHAHVSLHWSQPDGFVEHPIPPDAFFTDKAAAHRAPPPGGGAANAKGAARGN